MADLGHTGRNGGRWLALSMVFASSGCGDFLDFDSRAKESPVRLTDRHGRGVRNTSGAVETTTGITADSVGFVLGPGEGSLVIQLDTVAL